MAAGGGRRRTGTSPTATRSPRPSSSSLLLLCVGVLLGVVATSLVHSFRVALVGDHVDVPVHSGNHFNYPYQFEGEETNTRQQEVQEATQADGEFTKAQLEAFSKVRFFTPLVPSHFDEFRSTFLRSAEFFLPAPDRLKMTVVLDDTVFGKTNFTRQREMTRHVKSLFSHPDQVDVRYNPETDIAKYKRGWNIQQLIFLSADNFTDAELVARADSDGLWNTAVMPSDLFDERGRPRVIAKYSPTGWPSLPWLHQFMKSVRSALGAPGFVNGMSFLPIVVYLKHIRSLRGHMLRANPGYSSFNDLIADLSGSRKDNGAPNIMCDFCILINYLWDYHREEYSWHFEPEHLGRDSTRPVPNYPGPVFNVSDYPYLRQGSILSNGVSYEMLKPFPRVQGHAVYEAYGNNDWARNGHHYVSAAFRRGYCFSQVVERRTSGAHGGSLVIADPVARELCGKLNYSINADVNLKGEWYFEGPIYGPLWPVWDPEGVRRAHFDRLTGRKTNHKWNMTEVNRVFDPESIRQCQVMNHAKNRYADPLFWYINDHDLGIEPRF